MKLLGLTGNIACGKSTVASWLRELGATVLDADQLVHELYSDTQFSAQVALLFGDRILNSLGMVDRKQLSAVVFGDDTNLRRLELLVHPAVAALRTQKLRDFQKRKEPPSVVVIEAVKLLESGQARGCVAVWCVNCSPQTQLQRLRGKRGFSEEEARARLSAQPSHEEKEVLAREQGVPLVFLSNDASLEELKTQVKSLWDDLPLATSEERAVASR